MRKIVVKLWAFLLAVVLSTSALAQSENVLRYPIDTDPEHLNPFTAETIAISRILSNVYEGLLGYDPRTGDIVPQIAESYTVTEDENGRQVYTFNLRRGVLFHNIAGLNLQNREVTAEAVMWNYMTALSGEEGISARAGDLDAILGAAAFTAGEADTVEGLEVVDEYTFRITLDQPDRLFAINGMIAIASPEAYELLGDAFNSTPVGTGPFQFVEWLREDRLVLERNPDYYMEGLPLVDGVRFINYPDANTALLDYREGNLDFLFSFPAGQLNSIKAEFADDFNEKPGLHVRYWGFNMNNGFFAENPLVRQAFAHALDTVTAWDILAEGARFPATLGILPPSMPASTPAITYPFDLDRAAELLAEAGFPNGEGMPEIRISLLASISTEPQIVLWQQALESLGVRVVFDIQDGSTYWNSIVQDDAMLFINGWAAGLVDPSDVFDFLILDGRGSMRYNNPAVNELLRAARIELDEDVREALYQQAHDLVMADVPMIPSAYSKVLWLQRPHIEGFEPGGGGTYTARLKFVSINR
jgi:ABC-type transport system substrate-binding protein